MNALQVEMDVDDLTYHNSMELVMNDMKMMNRIARRIEKNRENAWRGNASMWNDKYQTAQKQHD